MYKDRWQPANDIGVHLKLFWWGYLREKCNSLCLISVINTTRRKPHGFISMLTFCVNPCHQICLAGLHYYIPRCQHLVVRPRFFKNTKDLHIHQLQRDLRFLLWVQHHNLFSTNVFTVLHERLCYINRPDGTSLTHWSLNKMGTILQTKFVN